MKSSKLDYIKAIIDGDKSNLNDEHKKRIGEALKLASENRKFEIELYWKRTQYFWAFLVTIYGTYFIVYSKVDVDGDIQKPIILLTLATLGNFFSLGWHLVNRGSKFWQQNWEYHVDELEEYIYGPVYKTIIAKTNYGKKVFKGFWFSPVNAYPYSVSNINCLLSGVIFIVSYILLSAEIFKVLNSTRLSNIVFHLPLSDLIFILWFFLSFLILLMFSFYSEGKIAKEFMENKDEKNQPVFFFRDKK